MDDDTGEFKIDGVTQPDSVIDLALVMTAPNSKTKPESKMKSFGTIAAKLSDVNFPNYLITNPTTRASYKEIYDKRHAQNPFMKSW